MHSGVFHNGGRFAVALVCALVGAAPALAQTVTQDTAAPVEPGLDGALPDPPLSPEDRALLGNALDFGPARYGFDRPAPSLRLPGASRARPLDVARTDNADGSGTVIVKQPLATEWDAKVGADLGLAANPSPVYRPDNPLRETPAGAGSGAAWASVDVPHIAATIDTRIDPVNDQGRLGTTFSRSVPLGREFKVTVRSGVSLTESLSPSSSAAADPAARVWGQENIAKVDILPTGTSLAAGLSSTSDDPVTHNTLSAEQKLYGPLRMTTAVTDIGQAQESKSIAARLKLNW